MRTKLASVALAGALGLTGVAGAALLTPAVSYAATGDSTALAERVASLREALAGLVTDGTLTQAQADSVASTIAESAPLRGPDGSGGPGGHGGHGGARRGVVLSAAAEALGMTEQDLRAAGEAGKTLADVAAEQGVEPDALVDALVAAAQERLATAVEQGRITQEQADARAADLEARITESLDVVRLPGGGGHGPRGGGEAPVAPESTTSTPGATSSAT